MRILVSLQDLPVNVENIVYYAQYSRISQMIICIGNQVCKGRQKLNSGLTFVLVYISCCFFAAIMEVDEVSTFTRVTSLSGKVRRRMYKRALGDLKGLQIRSKEKMERMSFTVDLVCRSYI